jgi:hypothetical protein
MTVPAAIVLAHWASPRGHVASTPVNWPLVIAVIASIVVTAAVAITIAGRRASRRRRDDDDTDFRGGGGRRGPDAPQGPAGDPAWWPEFERQFADYTNAPTPVMSRPTIKVCMVSVPSNVCSASMSAMCRMT